MNLDSGTDHADLREVGAGRGKRALGPQGLKRRKSSGLKVHSGVTMLVPEGASYQGLHEGFAGLRRTWTSWAGMKLCSRRNAFRPVAGWTATSATSTACPGEPPRIITSPARKSSKGVTGIISETREAVPAY